MNIEHYHINTTSIHMTFISVFQQQNTLGVLDMKHLGKHASHATILEQIIHLQKTFFASTVEN